MILLVVVLLLLVVLVVHCCCVVIDDHSERSRWVVRRMAIVVRLWVNHGGVGFDHKNVTAECEEENTQVILKEELQQQQTHK